MLASGKRKSFHLMEKDQSEKNRSAVRYFSTLLSSDILSSPTKYQSFKKVLKIYPSSAPPWVYRTCGHLCLLTNLNSDFVEDAVSYSFNTIMLMTEAAERDIS